MNRIQFRRWKDFALRMAERGWVAREIMRKEHRDAVIPAVTHFFDLMGTDFREDVIRIESWDDTRKDHYGHYPIGPFVCDIVSELLSDFNPFYWDDDESKAYESWDELWGGRIHCCIRAGIDLALNSSIGVLGFRKADIERMYPESVPSWISNGWKKKNGQWNPIQWEDISLNMPLWL